MVDPPPYPQFVLSRLTGTVIKLKQVEHVRNERKTLAAVVGHPFITNLVASFSDEQTLYMLVCLLGVLCRTGPQIALER